jgi:hypothetical protein
MDQSENSDLDLELQKEFEEEVKHIQPDHMAHFEQCWKIYAEQRRAGMQGTYMGFIIYEHFRSQFETEEEWQAYLATK